MTATIVPVALGERAYDIVIGQGVLAPGSLTECVPSRRAVVVTNTTVAPLWLNTLIAALGDVDHCVHTLPDGEQHKTMDAVLAIIDTALAHGMARDAVFVALGGGVVGDIAGFAAALFMRGVDFIQVPTTLLAQVDSSVGGKTGVNHARGKNLIGAFHQPRRVVIDTDTLGTLPPREFSAGMAEVIKHGTIVDADYFAWLEASLPAIMAQTPDALAETIERSCRIKAGVVARDEREQGVRALLNFGHTFGHAVEACTGYTEFLHGEAVAIGMRLAAAMSGLAESSQQRLVRLLEGAGLPLAAPGLAAADLLDAMAHDKKVLRGQIRLILLRELGEAFVSADYDPERLVAVLERTGG